MSIQRDYIPSANTEFFGWQSNLVTQVAAGAAGWGIAPADVTALQAEQTTYVALYNAILNPATKTKGAVHAHEEGRKVYERYIRTFVKEHLAYNPDVTPQNKIDMGLNPGDTPRSPRPAIHTAPFILLKALGNLQIQVECRVESDSSRPSIHPDADGVEIRSSEGNTAPPNYTEAANVMFKSKARFIEIIDDPTAAGKYVYLFARWVNTSDSSKSGPWSAMSMVMIS